MSFFGDDKQKKSIDDYFEQIQNFNMYQLVEGEKFREQFPDFAKKLGEELSKLEERPAKTPKSDKNTVEIDGHNYWWNTFNSKKQILRSNPGTGQGGGPGAGPRAVIIHNTINLSFCGPKEVKSVLEEYSKEALHFARIANIFKNGDADPVIAIEHFKLVKVMESNIP